MTVSPDEAFETRESYTSGATAHSGLPNALLCPLSSAPRQLGTRDQTYDTGCGAAGTADCGQTGPVVARAGHVDDVVLPHGLVDHLADPPATQVATAWDARPFSKAPSRMQIVLGISSLASCGIQGGFQE